MAKLSLPGVSSETSKRTAEQMRSKRRSGPARPTFETDTAGKRPSWIKVRLTTKPAFFELKELVREQGLHTVCESASCPNIGECWSRRALTFMILGNICTRLGSSSST